MAKFILVCLFLTGITLRSQNYTYRMYLHDDDIAGTIKNNFKKDTIQKYIGQFHDRLAYRYYLYQSVLTYSNDRNSAVKYLDTAFARGLDIPCMTPLIKQMFGDSIVNKSRAENYMTSFDLKLIQSIDSLHEQDQKYRQLRTSAGKNQVRSDSIMALWILTDSSNFAFLNALIQQDGYPTAKKIGYDVCRQGRVDAEIIIQHLGTKQRDFQIALLKQAVALCLKNEESWRKIDALQFNLHFRFCHSYSEFTFLSFKGKKLDVENSLFSLWVMAQFLQQSIKTMYLKCGSESVFNELKATLVELNWSMPIPPGMEEYEKLGFASLKKIQENQIVFVKDKSVPKAKVFYKIVD